MAVHFICIELISCYSLQLKHAIIYYIIVIIAYLMKRKERDSNARFT